MNTNKFMDSLIYIGEIVLFGFLILMLVFTLVISLVYLFKLIVFLTKFFKKVIPLVFQSIYNLSIKVIRYIINLAKKTILPKNFISYLKGLFNKDNLSNFWEYLYWIDFGDILKAMVCWVYDISVRGILVSWMFFIVEKLFFSGELFFPYSSWGDIDIFIEMSYTTMRITLVLILSVLFFLSILFILKITSTFYRVVSEHGILLKTFGKITTVSLIILLFTGAVILGILLVVLTVSFLFQNNSILENVFTIILLILSLISIRSIFKNSDFSFIL